MKKIKLKKIKYLSDLRCRLSQGETGYYELAMCGAKNLGGNPRDFNDAMKWLEINANETSEKGVVDEINFVIDIVEKKLNEKISSKKSS